MKTIENPGAKKLSLALIPVPLLCVYVIVTRSLPVWSIALGIASVVVYMALITYFCIKQKCYTQLAANYIVLIVWILTFYFQFQYI